MKKRKRERKVGRMKIKEKVLKKRRRNKRWMFGSVKLRRRWEGNV